MELISDKTQLKQIALNDRSDTNILESGQKEFSVIQKMIYLRSWNNYLDASGQIVETFKKDSDYSFCGENSRVILVNTMSYFNL